MYFYGMLGELLAKAFQENNMAKIMTNIEVYATLLKIVFLDKNDEVLKAKSIAVLKKNQRLEDLVNKLIEVKRSNALISLLKFIIYSKDSESFSKKSAQKSVENLLEATISDEKNERSEALHALAFMFDVLLWSYTIERVPQKRRNDKTSLRFLPQKYRFLVCKEI